VFCNRTIVVVGIANAAGESSSFTSILGDFLYSKDRGVGSS